MHMFSNEPGRAKRLWRLEEKYPTGTKILIEVLVTGVGICDPYPTDYISCRGSSQDFIAYPEDVRDLQQVIEAYRQAQRSLDEATADMKKVRDELEDIVRSLPPYEEKT